MSSNQQRTFQIANIAVVKGLKKRSKYTRVNPDSEFHASTPGQAASKAFVRFCKLNRKKFDECKINLGIREKNEDKVFNYSLERINDPTTVVIQGKPVVYKYKVIKKSLKK